MKLLQFLRAIFLIPLALFLTLLVSLITLFQTLVLRRGAASVQGLAAWWASTICKASGVEVAVAGTEQLDPEKPYIFAANHQSQFDIFVLQGFLGVNFRWLAKKELFAVPVWGPAMRRAGYIPIDRSHGRQALKSLDEAAQKIAAGTSVIIFPEGTRSKDGKLHDFKAGAMVLAIKSGVPIVPVAILGTYDILPKGKLLLTPGKVRIRVGRPIETKNYSSRDKHKLAQVSQEAVAQLFTHDFHSEN
ncbi:MAG: acyl-phosphate glycerol 3-phosphate acyltransferase [Desulfobacterales bacterium SG8_35]|nr:MAG: acyl-phosphate glycerol 3-phosphate acyltransferase [Desulfobacterales bacterium SG8_35]